MPERPWLDLVFVFGPRVFVFSHRVEMQSGVFMMRSTSKQVVLMAILHEATQLKAGAPVLKKSSSLPHRCFP